MAGQEQGLGRGSYFQLSQQQNKSWAGAGGGCSLPGCVWDQGPALWGGSRWLCNVPRAKPSCREGVFSEGCNGIQQMPMVLTSAGAEVICYPSSGCPPLLASTHPVCLEAGAQRTPRRALLQSREKGSGVGRSWSAVKNVRNLD